MEGLDSNSNILSPSERRKAFTRKREATSSLSEDLKRYNDKVLLMHHLIQNEGFHPQYSTFEDANLNSVEINNADINSNYYFSDHNNLSCVSQDDILKNIDITFELGSKSDIKSTPSTSNSDLSVHSAFSSVGIQEDLDCLHLAEDDVSNQETEPLDNQSYISPFVPSLFPKVPPTIYFGLPDERIEPFPYEISRLLRWRTSQITPVLIRETVERSGYKIIKEGDWLGVWDKHMKCIVYHTIKDYQRVNHFPGSFNLGRKDKMWLNYKEMHFKYSEDFTFFPETYILPQDLRILRKVWENDGPKKRWIIKPPASARGSGIKVINRWSQIPKRRPIVVQRYISDPYLINDSKFDMRLYVLVPSFNPLRIYIFKDGLVRFASVKYSTSVHSLGDRFMHLTNYSINKKSATYNMNEDDNAYQSHKWTLKVLQEYLEEKNIDYMKIWNDIIDIIIKTIICSEEPINHLIKNYAKNRYNCFELFGFDIMLDKSMKSWLIEVNVSPSLHNSSQLDFRLKKHVVKDMLNLVGYKIPNLTLKETDIESISSKYGIPLEEVDDICMNKTLHNWYLSQDEKKKHANFTTKINPEDEEDILAKLTSDDIRYLIESEDEFSRRGSFIRIFPTHTSSKYFQFFNHTRYYNVLLNAWEKKYYQNREDGISLLQNLCQKGYHLQTVFKEPPIMVEETMQNNV